LFFWVLFDLKQTDSEWVYPIDGTSSQKTYQVSDKSIIINIYVLAIGIPTLPIVQFVRDNQLIFKLGPKASSDGIYRFGHPLSKDMSLGTCTTSRSLEQLHQLCLEFYFFC